MNVSSACLMHALILATWSPGIKNNQNPEFKKRFELEYRFEENQELLFESKPTLTSRLNVEPHSRRLNVEPHSRRLNVEP